MNYTHIKAAKNGSLVPFFEQKPLHSTYEPEKEAQRFANALSPSRFFVILGLAGGYHISALLKRFPDALVIVLELDKNNIDFLSKIPEVSKILGDNRVFAVPLAFLSEEIKKRYIPQLHGSLSVASLRSWATIFEKEKKIAEKQIQNALDAIKADFSVQSHFASLWQRNIFLNLKTASEDFFGEEIFEARFMNKTAAIIAAGPSFDETAEKLKKERENYFVITTDTAFSALFERNIFADAVVSVDGQTVSTSHFLHPLSKKTLFVLDLCAQNAVARKAKKMGAKVIFCETAHPLSSYANIFSNGAFLSLEAGSGTVTIAAVSLAVTMGFKKIEFFGADFSYSHTPYTRGTYLDSQFSLSESRLSPRELSFSALMFRTELQKVSDDKTTTNILLSYKKSLEDFMKKNGFSELSSSKTRIFENKNQKRTAKKIVPFDFKAFCTQYGAALENMTEIDVRKTPSAELLTILPLASFENTHKKGISAENALIIAHDKTLRYTKKL